MELGSINRTKTLLPVKTPESSTTPFSISNRNTGMTQVYSKSSQGQSPSPTNQILLGDIIEFDSPDNPEYHQQSFIVSYIDEQKLRLFNIATKQHGALHIDPDTGKFTDESIVGITLLDRSEDAGFARQNGLYVQTWVDVYFGGELPAVITGEITNLDEDCIEITTYPDIKVIYIDFGYRGIPEDLPIEKIVIRDKPASMRNMSMADVQRMDSEVEEEEASMEMIPSGEMVITVPENAQADNLIKDRLKPLLFAEVVEEDLEEFEQVVEIAAYKKRYTIDAQINDMADKYTAEFPPEQRNAKTMVGISRTIARFKQLRDAFSVFDANENVIGSKRVGPAYKPMVDQMTEGKTRIRWILPVVQTVKALNADTDVEMPDVKPESDGSTVAAMSRAMKTYAAKESDAIEPAYDKMVRDMYSAMRPAYEPPKTNTILFTSPDIAEDIETLVDNYPERNEFESSAAKPDGVLVSVRRSMQRFIRGTNRVEYQMNRSGGRTLIHKPLVSGESYSQKSVIVFPKSVMRYFRVADRFTNIKTRANLTQTPFYYFRALEKNVMTKSIEPTQEPIEYIADSEEDGNKFMKTTQHIVPASGTIADDSTLRDILNVVFPDTKQLLHLFRPYFTGYSMLDIAHEMAPMGFNPSDITFKQYIEIRHLLKTKTSDLVKRIQTNRMAFNKYIEAIAKNNNDDDTAVSMTTKLFGVNGYMTNSFNKSYLSTVGRERNKQTGQPTYQTLSNSETLVRVLTCDEAQVFYHMCRFHLLALRSPEKIVLELSNIPGIDNPFCKSVVDKKRIAKHYSSYNALYADNGVVALYDKDKDDTPYAVLKQYSAKQKEMHPEEFVQYLKEALISKHGTPPDEALELAETLIRGKKKVGEGALASVPAQNAKIENNKLKIPDLLQNKTYFRRVDDHWVRDKLFDHDFDSDSINCNKENWCLFDKKKNSCESMDIASMRMRVASRNEMMRDLNDRVETAALMTEDELNSEVISKLVLLQQKKTTENVRFLSMNNLCNSLAKQLEVDTATMMESPYAALLTKIMGVADYSDKCTYLQQFSDRFCRGPMVDQLNESPHWLYCIDTNLKLVPQSVVRINNFLSPEEIQGVCDTYGTLEGNMIVDKHTGWKLLDAELVDDQLYDEEGRQVKSNDIMQEDIGNILMAMGKRDMRVFADATLQQIYNVFRTLSQSVGIRLDANEGAVEELTLRITSEMMSNKNASIIASEESYKKRMAMAKDTEKQAKTPYPVYLNQMLVLLTACSLFIAIQSMIPNFRTSKTFAGCVRAFGGFPLTGVENTAGILYMACVVREVSTSVEPWNGVRVLKPDTIKSRMQMLIQSFYMTRSDIAKYYEMKRDYVRMHPVDLAPEDISVEHRWPLFQPPIVRFTVKSKLEGVALNVEDEIVKSMRARSGTQHALIHGVSAKIMRNVFGLVEMVNAAVSLKDPLLVSKSNVPFVDNACCNDLDQIHPLTYFAKHNPEIDIVLKRLNSMMGAERYTKMVDKAPFIFHNRPTAIVRASIPSEFDPILAFQAVIRYCNFDTNMPIPREYYPVCASKPDNYSPYWTLDEKVEFLRANGKNYTLDHLYQLMKLVNDRNLVAQVPDKDKKKVGPMDRLRKAMSDFRLSKSTVFPEALCDVLDAAIGDYDEKVMVAEPRDSTIELKRVLTQANGQKLVKVVEFMRKYSNMNRAESNKAEVFLSQIGQWTAMHLQNAHRFVKTAVGNLCAIAPSMMTNAGPKEYKSSKHWGFAQEHEQVLSVVMNARRNALKQGKGADPFIQDIIREYMRICKDLTVFMDAVPVFDPIVKGQTQYYSLFNAETYILLFNYCIYTALHEYIAVAYDKQVVAREVPLFRRDLESRENSMSGSSLIPPMPTFAGEYNVDAETLDLVAEGDQAKGLENVGWVLKTLVDELTAAKRVANMPYSQILGGMDKTKAAEKRTFIEFFEKFDDRDERKAADLLKQFRLGRWAEGFSAKVSKYDKKAYDDVAKANADYERVFVAAGAGGAAGGGERADADQIANEENAAADEEWMQEAAGISEYGEDFDDGNYYPEDN